MSISSRLPARQKLLWETWNADSGRAGKYLGTADNSLRLNCRGPLLLVNDGA